MTTFLYQHSLERQQGWDTLHWSSNWDSKCIWHAGALGVYQLHPGATIPNSGIIAGCSQSTTFAKILLHAIGQQAYDVEIAEAMARGYPQ
eukprot:11187832-Karenia_brevis.AAC.1